MAATGGRSSKAKGSKYELELAVFFNDSFLGRGHSIQVRRALLSGGGREDGGADLDGLPLVWAEAKRTERTNIRDALRQAEAGIDRTKDSRIPAVITRRNREKTGDSIVALRLKDFTDLLISHYERNEIQ